MAPVQSSRPPTSSLETAAVPELLTITLVVSACSLLYELLIAQTLSLLAGNTVVWYSLTVGVYLGAMGLGSLLFRIRPGENPWTALFTLELLLSGTGAVAVILIHLAHSVHLFVSASVDGAGVFLFFALSLAKILLFPKDCLAMLFGRSDLDNVGRRKGRTRRAARRRGSDILCRRMFSIWNTEHTAWNSLSSRTR